MLPLLPKTKTCDNIQTPKIYGANKLISAPKGPYMSTFFVSNYTNLIKITK